jgi:type IV secretory pathway TraG/TraD family ATPase VirD4
MGTGGVALHKARFAKRQELRELLSPVPRSDGVLLGVRREYLFLKRFIVVRPTKTRREIGNTLIVGPTRSGKGLLATSQLLSWNHSVIVNDIKGELFTATAGYRATLGPVYVIDPTGVGHR